MPASPAADPTIGVKKIPVWGYLAIVVVYLVILQGTQYLLTRGEDVEYGTFTDSHQVWTNLFPSLLAAVVFTYAVVALLGWWRPVFVDHRPVRRWVWLVPGMIVATCLAGMYYGGLGEKGAGFVLALAVSMLLVGFGEEGMFRGLGVTTFRVNGYTELKVGLWTCVVFGLAHGTNLITEGPSALLQVLVTAAAGYFFYLTRRVSGGLITAALLHGLLDFSLLSSNIKDDYMYPGAALFVLLDVVLVIILVLRRRRIEPEHRTEPVPAT
jgi:membrane protease YdiL (CAAX protease family)